MLYPGSIERTSFAERGERKGYLTLAVAPDRGRGGRLAGWELHELPARPMRVITVPAGGLGDDELRAAIAGRLAPLPENAVVQLRIEGAPAPGGEAALRAASLRGLHPETMIVELAGGWPSALPAPRGPSPPRLRRVSSRFELIDQVAARDLAWQRSE